MGEALSNAQDTTPANSIDNMKPGIGNGLLPHGNVVAGMLFAGVLGDSEGAARRRSLHVFVHATYVCL